METNIDKIFFDEFSAICGCFITTQKSGNSKACIEFRKKIDKYLKANNGLNEKLLKMKADVKNSDIDNVIDEFRITIPQIHMIIAKANNSYDDYYESANDLKQISYLSVNADVKDLLKYIDDLLIKTLELTYNSLINNNIDKAIIGLCKLFLLVPPIYDKVIPMILDLLVD